VKVRQFNWVWSVAFFGYFALVPARGQAEELETSVLSYSVPAGSSCPDEASFRNLVAARLGYDPFVNGGKHATSVEFSLHGRQMRGRAVVTRFGSTVPGIRELNVNPDECMSLAAALATAVGIALDPARERQVASAPKPTPAPTPVAPLAPTPVPSAPAPPIAPVAPVAISAARPAFLPAAPPSAPVDTALFLRAGGSVSFGTAPSTAYGAELGIGGRANWFSLEAIGRAEVTAGARRSAAGEPRLEVTIISGGLLPCIQHRSGLIGCVEARFGALQGRSPDVTNPELGNSLFGVIGLRGGYRLKLSRLIALQATLEGGQQLVRTSLKIDKRAVWTSPGLEGGGSLSLMVNLL
jgi:hypothetical protein